MAFLSPGVYITERDESTIVPTVSNNVAFFAGDFDKGPVDQPYVITTRKELIDRFGLPTNDNYNEWFQASKYLDYANQLIITRGFEGPSIVDITSGKSEKTPVIVNSYTKLNVDKSDNKKLVVIIQNPNNNLPNFEIGDVVTFDAKNHGINQGSMTLCKVTDIDPGQDEITVHLEASSDVTNSFPAAGNILSVFIIS